MCRHKLSNKNNQRQTFNNSAAHNQQQQRIKMLHPSSQSRVILCRLLSCNLARRMNNLNEFVVVVAESWECFTRFTSAPCEHNMKRNNDGAVTWLTFFSQDVRLRYKGVALVDIVQVYRGSVIWHTTSAQFKKAVKGVSCPLCFPYGWSL